MKKNTAAATMAIDISQKEMPTGSLASKLVIVLYPIIQKFLFESGSSTAI